MEKRGMRERERIRKDKREERGGAGTIVRKGKKPSKREPEERLISSGRGHNKPALQNSRTLHKETHTKSFSNRGSLASSGVCPADGSAEIPRRWCLLGGFLAT